MSMNTIDLGKQKALRYFLSITIAAIAFAVAITSLLGLSTHWFPQNGLTIWCEVLSPGLFWFNLLFVLIWIKQRKFLSISFFANLIPLAIAFPHLFNISMQGSSEGNANNRIKVVTYNVRSFNYYSKQTPTSTADIAEWLLKEDPDVICLQEYSYFQKNQRKNLLDLLEGKYPFHTEQLEENHSVSSGNIILSKHKMIKPTEHSGNHLDDYLLWADIQIRENVVRLLNVHLKTTELNQSKGKIKHSLTFSSDRSVHNSSLSMISTFSENAKIRNQQAEKIKHFMDLSPHPVLVCGDFNATSFATSYRKVAAGMKSAFKENGRGYSYTYKPLLKTQRIDHILYSQEFEGIDYRSPSLPYSDHDPVVSTIQFPTIN